MQAAEPGPVDRAITAVCRGVLWLSTSVIFAILVANTVLRYATGTSLQWANEVPELLFPWLVMAGVVLAAHGRPVLKMINQYNSSLSAKKDQIQRVRDEAAAALEEANAKFEAMNATADVMRGKNLTPENLQPRKLSR